MNKHYQHKADRNQQASQGQLAEDGQQCSGGSVFGEGFADAASGQLQMQAGAPSRVNQRLVTIGQRMATASPSSRMLRPRLTLEVNSPIKGHSR